MLHKLHVYKHCIQLRHLCVEALAFCAKSAKLNVDYAITVQPCNPVDLQIFIFIFQSKILDSV